MPTEEQIKIRSTRARNLLVIAGVAVLLWSGLEDNDALLVTLLGALSAAAASMMLMNSRLYPARLRRLGPAKQTSLTGALIGTLASMISPVLMLFKDLRHAHVFPDYPAGMMLATLERMPVWALAGGLAGFGAGLLLKLAREWRKSREW